MDALRIRANGPLSGTVTAGGAKNAALPLLAACLLTAEPCIIDRVPRLSDVTTMLRLLKTLGVAVHVEGGRVTLEAARITRRDAPYEQVKTMRASILVLGPLLTRLGEVRVSLPGGCAIGARPIDLHLEGLTRMGAQVTIEHGYVVARAERLIGAHHCLDYPTVTGTMNLMMAATLADGTTTLENAAREPEVADLARFLVRLGARIEGAGSARITVHGVAALGVPSML